MLLFINVFFIPTLESTLVFWKHGSFHFVFLSVLLTVIYRQVSQLSCVHSLHWLFLVQFKKSILMQHLFWFLIEPSHFCFYLNNFESPCPLHLYYYQLPETKIAEKHFKSVIISPFKKKTISVSCHDHRKSDCLVVIVLTHGEMGILFAKDDSYQPETLWHYFTESRCSSLIGKPKLFFIQVSIIRLYLL